MSSIIQKATRLETAQPSDIEAILDHKLETTSAHQVSDYAALALNSIAHRIDEIKHAEAELKGLKVALSQQSDIIKEGVALWLSSVGLDKLQGNIVSSITVLKGKPNEVLIIDDEEALINAGYFKTVLNKTAVKDALLSDIDIEGAHIEVTHNADKIKVNHRKKKIAA